VVAPTVPASATFRIKLESNDTSNPECRTESPGGAGLWIVSLFRGSSRVASFLSHHLKFTCECNDQDTTDRQSER